MEDSQRRYRLNFEYSKVNPNPDPDPDPINFQKTQREIETSWIKKNILCIKDKVAMGNEKVEHVNNWMVPVGILTGLLMFIKGLLTGGLSVIGLGLQVFYFSVLSYAAVADKRGDWVSRFIPSFSGLLLCVSQIIGIFIINGPFECNDFESCL